VLGLLALALLCCSIECVVDLGDNTEDGAKIVYLSFLGLVGTPIRSPSYGGSTYRLDKILGSLQPYGQSGSALLVVGSFSATSFPLLLENSEMCLSLATSIRVLRLSIRTNQLDQLNLVPALRNSGVPADHLL